MQFRRSLSITLAAALACGAAGVSVAAAAPADSLTVGADATIEAEDFRTGDAGYSDTTGKNLGGQYRTSAVDIAAGGTGHYVGWTDAGEWLEYGLRFSEAGDYRITLTVASNQSTARTFHVEIDGHNVTGAITHTGTGWGNWSDVTADLGSVTAGSHRLRVVFDSGKLDLDRMVLSRTSTTGVTSPAASAPGSYPGQPVAGDVHWGAFYRSATGSTDLAARYENAAGQALDISRSYFSWSQRTSGMVNTARADLAAGRIPWVSIKPPSWAAMARGTYDAQIDQMIRALDALNGPVWLTVHHEPEGGGGVNTSDDPAGPAGHLAMNLRVRERMTALGSDNIALAPILMEWTFNSQSGRNPNVYWAPGVYDFLGVDTYSHSGTTFLDASWQAVRTWAGKQGVDVAVAEYGISGNGTAAAAVMQEFYQSAVNSAKDGRGARVVGLVVFDSGPKGWALDGSEFAKFREILAKQ